MLCEVPSSTCALTGDLEEGFCDRLQFPADINEIQLDRVIASEL